MEKHPGVWAQRVFLGWWYLKDLNFCSCLPPSLPSSLHLLLFLLLTPFFFSDLPFLLTLPPTHKRVSSFWFCFCFCFWVSGKFDLWQCSINSPFTLMRRCPFTLPLTHLSNRSCAFCKYLALKVLDGENIYFYSRFFTPQSLWLAWSTDSSSPWSNSKQQGVVSWLTQLCAYSPAGFVLTVGSLAASSLRL